MLILVKAQTLDSQLATLCTSASWILIDNNNYKLIRIL